MKKSDLLNYIQRYNKSKGYFRSLTGRNHPQMQKLINLYNLLDPNAKDDPTIDQITINSINKIIQNTTDNGLTRQIMVDIATQLNNEQREAFHTANRELFNQFFKKDDAPGLHKWLTENKQLSTRSEMRVLNLLSAAISKNKPKLINALLTTSHPQAKQLITQQYGTGVLCMLLDHGFVTQAKYLLQQGVSLTKPYDRSSTLANSILKNGVKVPFDEYDRVNGLTIVSSNRHAKIFEEIKHFDRGNNQDRTLAFQQALLECQPEIARALWAKGVDLNFVNGQGERAVNLALTGLSDYYERCKSQPSAEYCRTIWQSLVLTSACITDTRDFNLNNPRDKADFSHFVISMAQAIGSDKIKNDQFYGIDIRKVFKGILTHLIENNQLNHKTQLTTVSGQSSASLYDILNKFDPDLANDIKALDTQIKASSSQTKAKTQLGLFTLKAILKQASSTAMKETKPSPKVRFDM